MPGFIILEQIDPAVEVFSCKLKPGISVIVGLFISVGAGAAVCGSVCFSDSENPAGF